MGSRFEILAGEVLEIIYSDSNPNLIYGVKVKLIDNTPEAVDSSSAHVITARPLNINIVRIPIVGEIVLLIKAPSSYATGVIHALDIYYLDVVSLQSSIHHNALPTATKKTAFKSTASGNSSEYSESNAGNVTKVSEPTPDKNFPESNTVKTIQHYIGDLLINGRYGQSIRFSTTPINNNFPVASKWSSGPSSAPIAIYRSTYQTKNTGQINDFTTEDFTKDDNIIVQSSGQEIEFEQSSKKLIAIKANEITSWQEENWGETPQTLISSGRIVFNSTQKEIISFAKNGIGFSTETNIAMDAGDTITLNAPTIELGSNSTDAILLGTAWSEWMNQLITAIGTITITTPVGAASPITSAPQWAQIETLRAQIQTLLSQVAFVAAKKTVLPPTPDPATLEIQGGASESTTVETVLEKEDPSDDSTSSTSNSSGDSTREAATSENQSGEQGSGEQGSGNGNIPSPVNTSDRDFWTLVALCSREASGEQNWCDVAQSVYNRVGSKSYGGKTIADVILGVWQYEPTWTSPYKGKRSIPNPEWANIQTIEDAAKASNRSVIELRRIASALKNLELQKNSQTFIQGRTDFKGKNQKALKSRGKVQRTKNDNQFGWEYYYTQNVTYSVPSAVIKAQIT